MTELARFHKGIIEIYGHYSQTRFALIQCHLYLNGLVSRPGPVTASSDLRFGRYANPNLPDATYRYETTFGDLIVASKDDGYLHITHGRSVVVFIVESWEVEYRRRIANEVGLNGANDVTSDVFRDLNRYRNAILHTGSELRDEPRAIHFFRKGEEVSLTHEHMERIFEIVVEDLNRIGRDCYGTDPQFSFDIPLHG